MFRTLHRHLFLARTMSDDTEWRSRSSNWIQWMRLIVLWDLGLESLDKHIPKIKVYQTGKGRTTNSRGNWSRKEMTRDAEMIDISLGATASGLGIAVFQWQQQQHSNLNRNNEQLARIMRQLLITTVTNYYRVCYHRIRCFTTTLITLSKPQNIFFQSSSN